MPELVNQLNEEKKTKTKNLVEALPLGRHVKPCCWLEGSTA